MPVKYLYRILAVAVITLPLVAPTDAAAQKKTRSKLRAVSVLEVPGGTGVGKEMQIASSARLHAVTIFQNGEYQDANIYRVNPMPMALEPGTVYDVQQSGESIGLFTVESASKARDDWFAGGRWRSAASLAAAKHAPSPAAASLEETDERPKLKRGGGEPGGAQPAPLPKPAPSPTSATAPVPPPSEAPAQTTTSETAQASTPSPASASDTDPSESDPNRPALRRRPAASPDGRTAPTQVERKREPAQVQRKAAPVRVPAKESANFPAPALKRRAKPEPQFVVAISDADAYDAHSYKFPWTADERQRLTNAVEKQALAELAAYAGKSSRTMVPGSFAPSVQAFDLDYSNDAEIVLTAKCALRKKPTAGAPLNTYITYVVREESTGDLRKLFSEITDDDHMDVKGRLELVDAVDADGDSHAELLFRRVGVATQSFELYRAGRDQLWKLFEGAETSR